MKRLMGSLSVAALAVVLAAPLAAQTFRVTASIPFEFMVAERSMPAGDYTVQRAEPRRSGYDSGIWCRCERYNVGT